jgi:hypothetical protein
MLRDEYKILPSRKQLNFGFLSDAQTKHALAEDLAARFPKQLSFRLSPKRKFG